MSLDLIYNIYNWYWVVANTNPTTQVFQSSSGTFVANTTAAYGTWVGTNGSAALAITGAANNGSGLIRLTTDPNNFQTNDRWVVTGVGGTTEANGTWAVTIVDSTHVDLQGSTFTHAYTSGGYIGRGTPIDTIANLYVLINNFNVINFAQNSGSLSRITLNDAAPTLLTNTMSRTYQITPGASDGAILHLPQVNVPGGPPIGQSYLFTTSGGGSNHYWTLANVNDIFLDTICSTNSMLIWLTDNSTIQGTWNWRKLLFIGDPGADAQILISQSNFSSDGRWWPVSITGDMGMANTGAATVNKVHGVTYPASPSFNTVPVVTSSAGGGTVTYEAVPNAALANSSITLNAGTSTGLTVPGAVALGATGVIGNTSDNVKFGSLTTPDGASGGLLVNQTTPKKLITGSTSGHYSIMWDGAGAIQAFQGGDTSDPTNYFGNTVIAFYDRTISTLFTQIQSGHVYFPTAGTTASAANAFLNSGSTPANELLRSTSSRKYKTNILSLANGNAIDVLGQLTPVTYQSAIATDDPDLTHLGLIAEDVAQIDPRLVHFGYDPSDYDMVPKFEEWDDKDGHHKRQNGVTPTVKPDAVKQPESVQYERLTVLLLQAVQELTARVAVLEGGSKS